MVAAAGGEDVALSRGAGLAWLTSAGVLVGLALLLSPRVSMFNRTPLDKPPEVLADRAEQLRASFGYTDPVADRAVGFNYAGDYLTWARKQGAGASKWEVLASAQPAPLYFWRRTSPRLLIPIDPGDPPDRGDPPFVVTGMTLVDLDATGRLLRFSAVPPEVEAAAEPAPKPVDWSAAIVAAGFDPAALHSVTPERTPASYADERRAWEGTFPGTATKIRLEAAAYRGKIVQFSLVGAWSVPARDVAFDVRDNSTPPGQVVFILGLLIVAAVLARRNLRSGRADARGSMRLATFTFGLMLAIWALEAHVPDLSAEWIRLITGTAFALFLAGALYVVYLALEPFLRRTWPTMLVGWTRLLSGRLRDPIVGRDVLIGIAIGVGIGVLDYASQLLPALGGHPEPIPRQPQVSTLLGTRWFLLSLLGCANNGLQNGLISILQLALVRELMLQIVRRISPARAESVASALAVTLTVLINNLNNLSFAGAWWGSVLFDMVESALVLSLMLRIGLLATTVMFTASVIVDRMPLTLDASKFYAANGWFALALLFGVAAAGYVLATSQRRTADGRISART